MQSFHGDTEFIFQMSIPQFAVRILQSAHSVPIRRMCALQMHFSLNVGALQRLRMPSVLLLLPFYSDRTLLTPASTSNPAIECKYSHFMC